jgi:hypothetical protein
MNTGNGKSVTVFDGGGDSIDRAAARIDDSLTVNRGTLAKFEFETGEYATRDGDLLQAALKNNDPSQGRRFEVTGVNETWVKFVKNDEGVTIPFFHPAYDENDLPIQRVVLGDGYSVQKDGSIKVDKAKWEKKFNALQDPWMYTWLVYITDPLSCEIFTLQLKSKGGKFAWIALVAAIKERRRLFPGSVPLVELRWAVMPTKEFGEKKKPFFKICGWKINVDQFDAARPQPAQITHVETHVDAAQRQRTAKIAEQLGQNAEIDDELPDHLR